MNGRRKTQKAEKFLKFRCRKSRPKIVQNAQKIRAKNNCARNEWRTNRVIQFYAERGYARGGGAKMPFLLEKRLP